MQVLTSYFPLKIRRPYSVIDWAGAPRVESDVQAKGLLASIHPGAAAGNPKNLVYKEIDNLGPPRDTRHEGLKKGQRVPLHVHINMSIAACLHGSTHEGTHQATLPHSHLQLYTQPRRARPASSAPPQQHTMMKLLEKKGKMHTTHSRRPSAQRRRMRLRSEHRRRAHAAVHGDCCCCCCSVSKGEASSANSLDCCCCCCPDRLGLCAASSALNLDIFSMVKDTLSSLTSCPSSTMWK